MLLAMLTKIRYKYDEMLKLDAESYKTPKKFLPDGGTY
jgi:hypothetical protein